MLQVCDEYDTPDCADGSDEVTEFGGAAEAGFCIEWMEAQTTDADDTVMVCRMRHLGVRVKLGL
jgi:hypothetical protein